MSPRPLKTILDALTQVKYIKPLKNAYALDHLGLKFKQNIIKSIMSGRTDLSGPLTNRQDYKTELQKGHSTIYYNNKETMSKIFTFNEEKQKVHFLSNQLTKDAKLDLCNILKDFEQRPAMIYQHYLRTRRLFWKQFLFNPEQLKVEENEDKSSAQLKIKLTDFDIDMPAIEVETVDVMTENFGHANWNLFYSSLNINAGAMAMLLDARRLRQFRQNWRLALPIKAAPYALGIKVLDESQDAQDLSRYIQLLLESESIPLLINEEYKTYDDLGVPYVITIDKESLETGVIKIYDRETCWHEQVHLAYVAPRMVRTFQNREIPDTYSLVRMKYNL